MKKKFILVITFLCVAYNSNSQKLNTTYKFNFPVNNHNIQYKEGHLIKVIDTLKYKDSISFVYLEFKTKSKDLKKKEQINKLNEKYYYKKIDSTNVEYYKKNKNNSITNDRDLQIHSIEKTKFNNSTTQYNYYHRFKDIKAGIYTVPFKLRLNDFDFEQNVNLGMSLSFRFRMNRKYDNDWLISPTIGIGLSTVKLNPKNSNLNSDDENSNRTASAFSLSGGFLFELKDNINLSLQYGFDFLGNDDKDINWKYNKKPWLGIGVNVGFPLNKEIGDNNKDGNTSE